MYYRHDESVTVILCMLIQFPTVAIPVNVYMYKELSAIK